MENDFTNAVKGVLDDRKVLSENGAVMNATNWQYRAFPKSTVGVYSTETEGNMFDNDNDPKVVYGYTIDESASDGLAAVSYLSSCDNSGFTKAYMDFSTDKFNYGSWGDAFFIPKPCMLKYDGTVDYYLDPYDYTKKEDGTASDVANINYGGNAMMEFPAVFYKASKSGSKITVYVSDHKVDDEYECWSCLKSDGTYNEHFYMPIYEGYKDSSNRLRSMCPANTKRTASTTMTQEKTYAEANGDGWSMTTWADEELVRVLGVLLCGSIDMEKVMTNDITRDSVSSLTNNLGLGNAKGMFYGSSTVSPIIGEYSLKFFGMENWWGHCFRRVLGANMVNGVACFKMVKHTGDGSKCSDYITSDTASDYTGKYVKGGMAAITGYVSPYSQYGTTTSKCSAVFWPYGSYSGKYDGSRYLYAASVYSCLLGNYVNCGSYAGLFATSVSNSPSASVWACGASLSYRAT